MMIMVEYYIEMLDYELTLNYNCRNFAAEAFFSLENPKEFFFNKHFRTIQLLFV
jgi:hypothetical protein